MATLKEEHKHFIVTALAVFKTPQEIADEIKATFGIDVHRRQVHEYDPEGSKAAKVADKWKQIHKATRDKFLNATSDIPVANRAYRLVRLNKLVNNAGQRGAMKLEAELLEQAAKECGDVYTNRHKVEQTMVPHEKWLESLS